LKQICTTFRDVLRGYGSVENDNPNPRQKISVKDLVWFVFKEMDLGVPDLIW
jgi:hypothetical protein